MSEILSVEYEELIARAAELAAPLPAPPPEDPAPPCAVPFVVDSATQLALSALAIRDCISYCEQEYQVLAQSLRNVAEAYAQLDQTAAESMGSKSSASVSAVAPGSGGDGQTAAKSVAGQPYSPPPTMAPPAELPYYEVHQAAQDIEAPDQGPAFAGFADDWNSYAIRLQEAVLPRFRPFQSWDGRAAAAVEANFASHKKYIVGLVGDCNQVAGQARTVASAHKWAVTEHPSTYNLYVTDYWIAEYTRRNDLVRRQEQIAWYMELQEKSELVLTQYRQVAGIPLSPVYPSAPPAGTNIPPLVGKASDIRDYLGGLGGGTYGGGGGWTDSIGKSDGPQPANLGQAASNINDMVSGLTDTSGDQYADAAAASIGELPATTGLSVGGGVKPASFGGGGDVPSTPLQPSVDGESAARAGAGRGPGAAGANPGAGAAGGRGGMGMAPMGGAPGGGQGQGQDKKAKRLGDEEEIYTEDRPWTSAIIGLRLRNDSSDETHR